MDDNISLPRSVVAALVDPEAKHYATFFICNYCDVEQSNRHQSGVDPWYVHADVCPVRIAQEALQVLRATPPI